MRARPSAPALALLRGRVLAVIAVLLVGCERGEEPPAAAAVPRLVLYTSLEHDRVARIANAYGEASGTQIDFLIDAQEALADNMAAHDRRPAADVLLTAGLGAVVAALDEDVLRPLPQASEPGFLDDPDGYWRSVGSVRDLLVFDPGSVDAGQLDGYAALAAPEFSGRLCLRRGLHDRSRALVASLIAALGERDAELTVRGWRNNLATGVFDSEDELVEAVAAGTCAVAIAGSDALRRHRRSRPDSPIGVVAPAAPWHHPTTVGIARHANDADRAARFVDWLLSADGQAVLHADGVEAEAGAVLPGVTSPAGSIPPARAAFRYADAVLLIERARYR